MDQINQLTKREEQIAELIAWGASAKEVPWLLQKLHGGTRISYSTVVNTLRNIYIKLPVNKANELSAWWFCTKLGVDSSISPILKAQTIEIPPHHQIRKTIYSVAFLILLIPQILTMDDAIRPQRTRAQRARTEQVRLLRARRKE